MNVYLVSFTAQRESCGAMTIRVQPGIVLSPSEEGAKEEATRCALAVHPESDGWANRGVVVAEMPDRLLVAGYCLTWQVEAHND